MSKYFATFGDRHPERGGKYVEIAADNFGNALEIMKKHYHTRWSLLLDEREFESYKVKHPEETKYGGILT